MISSWFIITTPSKIILFLKAEFDELLLDDPTSANQMAGLF
jgi:hypothetical protein